MNLNICRICLEHEEMLLISLTDHIRRHCKSYLDLYQEIAGSILDESSIENDEKLPGKVCTACSIDLVEAYELKKRIETSERLLSEIVLAVDAEEISDLKVLVVEEIGHIETTVVPLSIVEPELVTSNEVLFKLNSQRTSICPHCNKSITSTHLLNHIKTVHSCLRESFICDICGKTLSTKNILTNHIKTIHLNRMYQCRYCESPPFKSRNQRRSHEIQSHTFKFKFQCVSCPRKFLSKEELMKHDTNVHTGEKNFVCEICAKEFSHRRALADHVITHRDSKDFPCDICSSAFKTKRLLLKHKTCHRKFNYECPVCHKMFYDNKAMRKHCEKKHQEHQLPPKGTVMNKNAIQKIMMT